MPIKSRLLAGFLVFTFVVYTAAYTPSAQAMENDTIILAQNDDSGGLWNRIFNRSGEKSQSKPLFLDKAGTSSSKQVKPYDFSKKSASQARAGTFSDLEGQQMIQQRDSAVIQRTQEVLKIAALENEKNSAQAQDFFAKQNEATAANNKNTKKKTMAYDPEKVWSYNPNAPQSSPDQEQKSRIYNTR
ncbi:MAG: hypothetical protein CO093_04150 [Alphaproteobacteria bacterium CG_4_9_14_3_um_filter_47_13]|nr:MAG: hypothetical protein CO093_04150 [Alphaproteobacteria bacterium CG_4_9_14_3_um_filter_47_13]